MPGIAAAAATDLMMLSASHTGTLDIDPTGIFVCYGITMVFLAAFMYWAWAYFR